MSASFVLDPVPGFPAGSTVALHPESAFPGGVSVPIGASLASAVTDAFGHTAFSGLEYDRSYFAFAPATGQRVRFHTDADPTRPELVPLAARMSSVESGLLQVSINVRAAPYNATGDGATDDTAAIQAALTAAGVNGALVYFPPGTYMADNLKVPDKVDMLGAGARASILRFRGTAGGKFVQHYGSHCTVELLTIDGQRANQPEDAGKAAIEFAKPNGTTAASTVIAGGLLLTAGASIGATSLAVSTATWTTGSLSVLVQRGDVINLSEGGVSEQVEVARSYTPGALTIPLVGPVVAAFTTAAKVSVYSTCNEVSSCRVFGCGRDGISFFHAYGCVAKFNRVFDCSDTGIDFPAGCLNCEAEGNLIVTNGRWGVYIDGASATDLGPAGDFAFSVNRIRFLNGGTDALGTMKDCIGIGTAVSGGTINGNVCDIRKGGRAGVMLQMSGSPTGVIAVVGNTVRGSKIADSTGVRVEMGSSGALNAYVSIVGNTLQGLTNGVDLGSILRAAVIGGAIRDVTNYGVNANINSDTAQEIVVIGVHVETCTAGVRFGGTGGVGSIYREWGNVVTGASFAKVTADSGWSAQLTDGLGQIDSTMQFQSIRPTSGSGAFAAKVVGDTTARWVKFASGREEWGSGAAVRDVALSRLGVDLLGTDSGDKFVANGGLGVGNSAAATEVIGKAVVKKIQVFDAAGTSLGFIPVYSSIT